MQIRFLLRRIIGCMQIIEIKYEIITNQNHLSNG